MSFFDDFYKKEINDLKVKNEELNTKVRELELRTGMSIDGINNMFKKGWKIEWKPDKR